MAILSHLSLIGIADTTIESEIVQLYRYHLKNRKCEICLYGLEERTSEKFNFNFGYREIQWTYLFTALKSYKTYNSCKLVNNF